jgi:hypothetical protein
MACRHNEPPKRLPGVRQIGHRRFVANLPLSAVSGGLGPLRGLEASCTPAQSCMRLCELPRHTSTPPPSHRLTTNSYEV